MKFGKVPPELVETIDWKIPADDPLSLAYLKRYPSAKPTQYHLGAPLWGHKDWVGKIYPSKAKAKDFLSHYAKVFSCIELNTTHYRIPTLEQTKRWTDEVPKDFLFCAKVFQGISHARTGLVDTPLLKQWFSFLEKLGENRGPSFIQLPPSFDYSSKALLFKFLQAWPSEYPLAMELRHPTWFDNSKVLPGLVEYLQSRGIALMITDVLGRRDVLHTSITAPFAMVRFVGNDLHPADFKRIALWKQKFRSWEELGLKDIYFFIHQPEDENLPELAIEATRAFNEGRKHEVVKPVTFIVEKSDGPTQEALRLDDL